MPSNRMSGGTTTTQKVTLKAAPTPAAQGPQRQSKGSQRAVRDYSPTRSGEKLIADVGLLEVEFLACLFLLVLLLFTDTADTYENRMMSLMKRGTLLSVLFFVLAIIAASSQNAAKVAKGIGAMVFVATILSTPSSTIFSSLDSFFKADWTPTSENAGDTAASADTGTQSATSGSPISTAENAAAKAANTITDINIPGIGPIFAAVDSIPALKKLFHL